MKIFKTPYFHRWAASEGIPDSDLKEAVEELSKGLHDGSLGSSCYKKRLAVSGRGKRGGVRTIVAFQAEKNAFFLYGYAKKIRANISDKEKAQYRKLSKTLLGLTHRDISKLIKDHRLIEVKS